MGQSLTDSLPTLAVCRECEAAQAAKMSSEDQDLLSSCATVIQATRGFSASSALRATLEILWSHLEAAILASATEISTLRIQMLATLELENVSSACTTGAVLTVASVPMDIMSSQMPMELTLLVFHAAVTSGEEIHLLETL